MGGDEGARDPITHTIPMQIKEATILEVEASTGPGAEGGVDRATTVSHPILDQVSAVDNLLTVNTVEEEQMIRWILGRSARARLANKPSKARISLGTREMCASFVLQRSSIYQSRLATTRHATSAPYG